MIGLLVWPCSNPSHKDCFSVIDILPLFLDLLQKQEVRKPVYLEDHLSYDDAWALLRTDLLFEARDTTRTGTNLHDITPCNNPSHPTCYSIIDIEASLHTNPNEYIVEHINYIEPLNKLYNLWPKQQ
jgi:hypothetical protein